VPQSLTNGLYDSQEINLANFFINSRGHIQNQEDEVPLWIEKCGALRELKNVSNASIYACIPGKPKESFVKLQ
jgi:hypothetical protein